MCLKNDRIFVKTIMRMGQLITLLKDYLNRTREMCASRGNDESQMPYDMINILFVSSYLPAFASQRILMLF